MVFYGFAAGKTPPNYINSMTGEEPAFRKRDMADKDLKRLSRTELLELLLQQTRERERLEQKLEEVRRQLADRQIRLEKAGDIAHATMEINGVMAAAQAAARQYLENMERLERQTRQRCEQMLRQARQEAEDILQKAKQNREIEIG